MTMISYQSTHATGEGKRWEAFRRRLRPGHGERNGSAVPCRFDFVCNRPDQRKVEVKNASCLMDGGSFLRIFDNLFFLILGHVSSRVESSRGRSEDILQNCKQQNEPTTA